MQALGVGTADDPEPEVILGQFVTLVRDGEQVRLSKRTGNDHHARRHPRRGRSRRRAPHVPAAEHRHDADVRPRRRHRAVDGEPRVLRAVRARAGVVDRAAAPPSKASPARRSTTSTCRCSVHERELDLLRTLAEYPEVLRTRRGHARAAPRRPRGCATSRKSFHGFYRDCRVITDDAALTQARLWLTEACRIGLADALGILGVSAPEVMERLDADDEDEDVTVDPAAPFDRSLVPPGLLDVDLDELAAQLRHSAVRLRRGPPSEPLPGVRRRVRRRQRGVRGQGVPVPRDGPARRRRGPEARRGDRRRARTSRSEAAFPRAGSSSTATTRATRRSRPRATPASAWSSRIRSSSWSGSSASGSRVRCSSGSLRA